jgi:serine/threonine protein kinase/tetratricopeptide (TPR) repeat protein
LSNKQNQLEQSPNPQDADATRIVETPSEPTAGATGEYDPTACSRADQEQPNGPVADDATAVLPPASVKAAVAEDTRGTPLPGSRSSANKMPTDVKAASDVTTLLPPHAPTAPAGDATMEGGTAIYDANLPCATQAPAKHASDNRDGNNTDATGIYEASDAGGVTATVQGARLVVDPNRIAVVTPESTRREEVPSAGTCGRYVLKRFHAKGGMGEIWLADDPAIGRSVALKRMLSHRPDQQRRFRVEAQVTGQLEHPGIVPVHELAVNEQGHPFYVMKFVRGRTLQKVIDDYHAGRAGRRSNSPPNAGDLEVERFRLLQIFLSLCQTVGYAHSRGVLHRDLKPENVMLGPYGETLLLDWGIAKVMGQPDNNAVQGEVEAQYVHLLDEGQDTETRAGTIMGSLSYMAPEVAAGRNKDVDQRSDVYLLAGILYAILTGNPPRIGKNQLELIKQAQRELPPAPRKVNPLVPRPLDAICLKGLALRPEDRYQTALALAEDVQRYSAGEPVSAYREGFMTRAWRWAKRHRTALARSAATILLVCLIGFGYYKYRDFEERQAEAQKETNRLKEQEQAREDLKEFRRLADDARYYAATTDPVSENAPYFDPRAGEEKAKAALAVAAKWGPTVEQLPLTEERDPVRQDVYDLLLLLAQTKVRLGTGPEAGRETLALLEEAAPLREQSRGFFRLRSRANERLGNGPGAAEDQLRADAPRTPATALDHFLLGEQYRTESAAKEAGDEHRKAWQPDPLRMEKAIAEYRLALEKNPDHFWSLYQLGRCYLALGKYAEAVEALGTCVALRPDAPWGYSVRGFALAEQHRYAEAERDLDLAVQKNPDFRPARLNRGVVYWRQGQNEKALADFAAVLQPPAEIRLVEAAYIRGQLYLQGGGKMKEALADFDLVVAERPKLQPVYLYRAQIYIAQNQGDRALTDMTTYLQFFEPALVEQGWEAAGKRGHLLRYLYLVMPAADRQKDSGRATLALALAELHKAVEMGGKNERLFDDLGTMLYHAGRVKDALTAYGKGLALAPDDALLLIKRGSLYDALNQQEKALADFSAAARAEPENAEAHSWLGYVRAVQKSGPEAQREAGLALLHGADKYLVLHNVACIYSVLSQVGDRQAAAHQDAAMALLHRAVQLWEREGTGLNEIDQIKGDPSLKPLQHRPDFQELIGSRKP